MKLRYRRIVIAVLIVINICVILILSSMVVENKKEIVSYRQDIAILNNHITETINSIDRVSDGFAKILGERECPNLD